MTRALCITTACQVSVDGPQPTAAQKAICARCIYRARLDLRTIAAGWHAAHQSLRPAQSKSDPVAGSRAIPLPVDTDVADRIRDAKAAVWFIARVVIDERKNVEPPKSADLPTVARWLVEGEHVEWIAGHKDADLVQAVCDDLDHHARSILWCAEPVRARLVPVGIRCTEHGTSDMGERVECEGMLRAVLGVRDGLPDLVCTADRSHVVDPATWTSKGFNRKMDREGAINLRQAITGGAE